MQMYLIGLIVRHRIAAWVRVRRVDDLFSIVSGVGAHDFLPGW